MISCYICGRQPERTAEGWDLEGWKWVWNDRKRPQGSVRFACTCQNFEQLRLFG